MREKTHDIYPYYRSERAIKSFQKTGKHLSNKNQELILAHIDDRIRDHNRTDATRTKYLYDWGTISQWITKDLDQHTEDDLKALIDKIRTSEYSERSKETYIVKLKLFYKWLKQKMRKQFGEWEKAPRELRNAVTWLVDEFRFSPDKDRKASVSFLTRADVLKLLEAADTVRDRALIALLWSTGCRIGEILTLQIRDVKPLKDKLQGHGYTIELRKSKTKERVIPVLEDQWVNTTRYLAMQIMERESAGASPDESLFVTIHGTPLEYRAAKKSLDGVVKRCGTKKRIHFHAFRKGRATDLAEKGWSEAQMNQVLGWKHGSKMPAVYIQRSGLDVTKRMAQDHGLIDVERVEEEFRTCLGCQAKNAKDKMYCGFCGRALDPVTIADEECRKDDTILELAGKAYNIDFQALIASAIEKRLGKGEAE